MSRAGCWAYFILILSFPTFLDQLSPLNQVPQGGTFLCVVKALKMGDELCSLRRNRLNKLGLGKKVSPTVSLLIDVCRRWGFHQKSPPPNKTTIKLSQSFRSMPETLPFDAYFKLTILILFHCAMPSVRFSQSPLSEVYLMV